MSRWRIWYPKTTSTAALKLGWTSRSSGIWWGRSMPTVASLRRPGRLLQAAASDVLRGHPLGAPTHECGRRPPLLEVVRRIRSPRVDARPFLPHPHQGTLRLGGLPPFLREDRRRMHRGRAGVGRGALLRRHQGRGKRFYGEPGPEVLGRGLLGRALRG